MTNTNHGTASLKITILQEAKLPTYPGGKSGSGTYQAIINQQPPHKTYIEPFLGHGGILRHKRPADRLTIGIEINPDVIANWKYQQLQFAIIHGDGSSFLRSHTVFHDTLVYCDPP